MRKYKFQRMKKNIYSNPKKYAADKAKEAIISTKMSGAKSSLGERTKMEVRHGF